METKHTPGPWFLAAQNDGLVIIDGPPSPAPYDGPIPKAHGPNVIATPNFRIAKHEANAAFIVHAVNCHDELLTALEALQRQALQSPDLIETEWGQEALGLTRAAIAKAKGLATDDTSCNKPSGEAVTEKDLPY